MLFRYMPFDDLFDTLPVSWERRFQPSVDAFRNDKDLVLTLELPGVEPGDIEVNVTGDRLEIRGKRKRHSEEVQFERTFTLPERAKPEDVKASYAHGVLEITIPSASAEARKVPIQVGEGQKKEIKAAA